MLRVLGENVGRVKELLVAVVPALAAQDWSDTIQTNLAVAKSCIIG